MRHLSLLCTLALTVGLVAACGDDDGGNADIDASAIIPDADLNAADADPNAPDADPNAPDGAPVDAPVDLADADPNAPDADLTPDGAVGVACGTEVCDPASQECCNTFSMGQQQQMCVDTGTCEGQAQVCDGPEDCPGGEVCCAGFQTGNSCETECGNSLELCHTTSDCSVADEECCPGGAQLPDYCAANCFTF